MLFNSYSFFFCFLPVTLLIFFHLGRYKPLFASLWLFAASLFFYAWWNPAYVGLLLTSVLFNYAAGRILVRKPVLAILTLSIAANLSLLAYYKYANFFVSNISLLLDKHWSIAPIILPLGISFFTFTQIAFLVDAYRGEVREASFINYALFVTYFPHLIAGPVLHHKEMMPQFSQPATYRINWENIAIGLTLFTMGLFKKIVLADGIAPFVNPVFDTAAQGGTITLMEAWGGALSYTFQLYFDFSGYSDMAIGLSRMFGIKLPLNFNSPYKAVNIIDFWRRWHMTLSRFLRDYLYFPLGGNRKGRLRRYLNLLLTMLLGGLWHGAGWTFLLWGGVHGAYLIINHVWRTLLARFGYETATHSPQGRLAGMAITFLAVTFAWVVFRAATPQAALNILGTMTGFNGITLPGRALFPLQMIATMEKLGIRFAPSTLFYNMGNIWGWIAALWFLAWCAPNSQQILAAYQPALEQVSYNGWLRWRPNRFWLACTAICLLYSITEMERVSEFLYFQF
ncbi:MAG: MBOAT family protein [Proteobacteria bacterium]|nr:MBOAT family protein [Pseudomonadota bacterium]